MSNKRFLVGLALAFAILLAFRLPLLRCGAFGADVANFADEANYVWLADSLAAGNTVADTYWFRSRAPVTALLLLGLGKLRGVPPEFAVCDFQIVQVLLWAAIMSVITAITAALWGRRTALLAALLLALLPDAAMLTLLVYSETLFTAALVAVVGALLLWSRRKHFGWLVAAGVAAGIGALARPTMLPLLPVFALWAAWVMGDGQEASGFEDEGRRTKDESPHVDSDLRPSSSVFRRLTNLRLSSFVFRLLPAALIILACALVIAPWTIRNYRAYGGLILIDTTGSVVLWSDNKPDGSDTVKDDIQAASTNPVERQRFATQEALETIGADPARFSRKLIREAFNAWGPVDFSWTAEYWGDLLRQPRLAALFAQWHSLMLMSLPLALLGLLYAPHQSKMAQGLRLGLLGICLIYTLMIGITHFEERYRTPFLVLLLPYAAWSLAHPRLLIGRLRQPAGMALVALLVALGVFYSRNLWPDQWNNGKALALNTRGYLRAWLGDTNGAIADQQRAAVLMPTLYEAQVAAAQLRAASGDAAGAEEQLRATISEARSQEDEPTVAVVALQRLLVARGNLPAADDLDDQLSIRGRREAESLFWGKGATPGSRIDLGTNDLGLIEGFYQWQSDQINGRVRWSRPQADLLLSGQAQTVCLRLNAARPADLAAPTVRLSARVAGDWHDLGTITPPRNGWVWGCTPAPQIAGVPWTLRIETALYSPFLHNQSSDTRQLGVALAEVTLRDDTPSIDPTTGLLLDRVPTPAEQSTDSPITLLGMNGDVQVKAGQPLAMILWWRGQQSPPQGAFTFVHLLDASGKQVAAYNAPLAGGAWPTPWAADEPLDDSFALPLPAELAPGSYKLVAGAFDPSNGQVYVQGELGDVQVK